MKRILLITSLFATALLAACGGQSHSVSQSNYVPLGIGTYAPDPSGGTSTRSSFDLLSLT